jgi:tetratricopeptide (TPR) repeat protein
MAERKNIPPEGEVVTFEEAERELLRRLAEGEGDFRENLWQLVRLYSFAKMHDKAMDYIHTLIQASRDNEENASLCLALGQLMEQKGDYLGAIEYYRCAFSLKPAATQVWYLVNNNVGFCLNEVGRYEEAEGYLLAAIQIDPGRPNAYKNLGLSFQGQGELVGAAECFIEASRVNARDPRAFGHLESLLAAHPEIEDRIPGLQEKLRECRLALEEAARPDPALMNQYGARRGKAVEN